jgi:hypothetical protein
MGIVIVRWTLIECQQLMKFNLGINVKPQMVKINAQLETSKVLDMEQLLKEFKVFLHGHTKICKGFH